MAYELFLNNVQEKNIYPLDENFKGESQDGEELSFTNYYMEKNGKPFFGVSGEFHFSRMSEERWEDELIKMKMCGINIVSTYVFWIHHEEEEGIFDFSGRRDIRRFVELCAKYGLYVILRAGPFDHGEVRNGGLPDWLYGKPFEVRKISEGFLHYTARLYKKVAGEVKGMFFKDGGPIIGVQIDNEYMHSSAPWEITTGISDEWVFQGNEGEAYMLRLKELAAECGLTPVFYTCTGWGGAPAPKSMMPLWGGYAFRPWIFYSYKGEHPATEEYVYQDFHNNHGECTNDFKPTYQPEEKPYACCEMGGGMGSSYYYRFQYPFKSVDAMANIKMGSGCNFLGYYMFQGGSNPTGKHGGFMNEGQMPKISYDYQAPLGEFGQVRESYRRLKTIHYFTEAFGERMCGLKTVLPAGASYIKPEDKETLRYGVRTDGKRGFLFLNNYQDHVNMPYRRGQEVRLRLKEETLSFSFDLAEEENGILPFHFDMDGIDLVQATAQPITRFTSNGERVYVFFVPDGMEGNFVFQNGVAIDGRKTTCHVCKGQKEAQRFVVETDQVRITVLVLSRAMADRMYLVKNGLVFTDGGLLEDGKGLRLETTEAVNTVYTYPADLLSGTGSAEKDQDAFLGCRCFRIREQRIEPRVSQVSPHRYVIEFPPQFMEGIKDAYLQLSYTGNIGHGFLDGRMIHDNFCNGDIWEIGLKDFAEELAEKPMTIYITPIKEGAKVHVDSPMAARAQEAKACIGELKRVGVRPVYEIELL